MRAAVTLLVNPRGCRRDNLAIHANKSGDPTVEDKAFVCDGPTPVHILHC
jgi:hypothetical protein